MKINEKLLEQKNHGHYDVCRSRMNEIKVLSKQICRYTVSSCVFLAIFTCFGVNLGIFSAVPWLFGKENLFSFALQIAEIILFGSLAVFSAKNSRLNIVIFAVYCLLGISTVFDGLNSEDYTALLISIGGIIVSAPSVSAYSDYRQLSETEGFPYFSLLFAPERNRYDINYEKDYSSEGKDPDMPEAEEAVGIPVFTGTEGEMDDFHTD